MWSNLIHVLVLINWWFILKIQSKSESWVASRGGQILGLANLGLGSQYFVPDQIFLVWPRPLFAHLWWLVWVKFGQLLPVTGGLSWVWLILVLEDGFLGTIDGFSKSFISKFKMSSLLLERERHVRIILAFSP